MSEAAYHLDQLHAIAVLGEAIPNDATLESVRDRVRFEAGFILRHLGPAQAMIRRAQAIAIASGLATHSDTEQP